MIQGILLAAGRSSRFGDDKLRQPLADGSPMILAAAATLESGVDAFMIVASPDNYVLHQLLDTHDLPYHICPDAHLGMGHSLAFGVAETSVADGWIVGLADMPFIQTATMQAVTQALRNGETLIAPFYQGKRGHPVGFGSKFRSELMSLTGDQGARRILQTHANQLHRLDCDDPGVLQDIDTPAALQAALEKSS